jgi:hypothetical protein
MSRVYYALAFAGRVLHVDNNAVECNKVRDKVREEFPEQAECIVVRQLPYPSTNTVEGAFEWINSLLSGEVLSTLSDQEVA